MNMLVYSIPFDCIATNFLRASAVLVRVIWFNFTGITRSSQRRCSVKMVFVVKQLFRSFFFNKVVGLKSALIFEKYSIAGVFL